LTQGIDPRHEKRDRIAEAEAKRAEAEPSVSSWSASPRRQWKHGRSTSKRAPRGGVEAHLGDHAKP
jgi:hypothetical protein